MFNLKNYGIKLRECHSERNQETVEIALHNMHCTKRIEAAYEVRRRKSHGFSFFTKLSHHHKWRHATS